MKWSLRTIFMDELIYQEPVNNSGYEAKVRGCVEEEG